MKTGTIVSFKEDQDIIDMYDAVIEGKIARLPKGFWGNHEEEIQHRLKLCFRYVVLHKLKIQPQEILYGETTSFLKKYKLFNIVYQRQTKGLKKLLNDIFPEIGYQDEDIISMYNAVIEGELPQLPNGFWGNDEEEVQHRLKLCLRYIVLQKLKMKPHEILFKVKRMFLAKYSLYHGVYHRQSKGLTELLNDTFPEIGYVLPGMEYQDEEIINTYDAVLEGKLAQLPPGFWGNYEEEVQHRLKLCLRYVVLQKLKIHPQEILFVVKKQFFMKYMLFYAHKRQSKGITELLNDTFPEIGYTDEDIINIYDAATVGKLTNLPRSFWGEDEVFQHRFKLCFRYIVLQKLKMKPYEIHLRVTDSFLKKYKLSYCVYQRQSKGLEELLNDIFPEVGYTDEHNINNIIPEVEYTDESIINMYDAALKGEIVRLPKGFWGHNKEDNLHRLILCLRYVVLQKLKMKPHEILLEVKRPFLMKYKLYYAHQRQSKGLNELLIEVFPEIGYEDEVIINIYDAAVEGKLAQLPHGFWGDKEVLQHRLKLCLRHVVLQRINMKPQEILSEVTKPFLIKYKLYYGVYQRQRHSKRLKEFLIGIFPEINNSCKKDSG
ncbi:DUF4046 domain-containing protein [Paenibacillus polymyxa]|uniref:DUF4046 domain-containing protein n=1 Tax=Paenibacillus polymyxa (strain SC2) TaxID=886882 RepID=E3EKF4_PAEPS|nr:DUF4046 domain-containing protein [Paenibacillus polymyxa]ADO59481.1 hypothetical protein PPSC2_27675 [Paenibacillus polymyxa SC2]WPQ59681.1 DUF4046 domain-containing protein [Paenibacillus polymyxa]